MSIFLIVIMASNARFAAAGSESRISAIGHGTDATTMLAGQGALEERAELICTDPDHDDEAVEEAAERPWSRASRKAAYRPTSRGRLDVGR